MVTYWRINNYIVSRRYSTVIIFVLWMCLPARLARQAPSWGTPWPCPAPAGPGPGYGTTSSSGPSSQRSQLKSEKDPVDLLNQTVADFTAVWLGGFWQRLNTRLEPPPPHHFSDEGNSRLYCCGQNLNFGHGGACTLYSEHLTISMTSRLLPQPTWT